MSLRASTVWKALPQCIISELSAICGRLRLIYGQLARKNSSHCHNTITTTATTNIVNGGANSFASGRVTVNGGSSTSWGWGWGGAANLAKLKWLCFELPFVTQPPAAAEYCTTRGCNLSNIRRCAMLPPELLLLMPLLLLLRVVLRCSASLIEFRIWPAICTVCSSMNGPLSWPWWGHVLHRVFSANPLAEHIAHTQLIPLLALLLLHIRTKRRIEHMCLRWQLDATCRNNLNSPPEMGYLHTYARHVHPTCHAAWGSPETSRVLIGILRPTHIEHVHKTYT